MLLHDAEGDRNDSLWRRAKSVSMAPEVQQILDRDSKVFVHQALSTPCLDALSRTKGSLLESLSGQRYLDFHGNSVHQLGYGHPKVLEALQKVAEEIPFCPRRFTHEGAVRLGERLIALANTPRLDRLLLMPSGTGAISAALRLARLATGKPGTIAWWDSFHGAGLDASALGGEALFREGIGALGGLHLHWHPPVSRASRHWTPLWDAWASPEFLADLLDREPQVGALVLEPIRCTGVWGAEPSYWAQIREICDRRGVWLILDEIPLGFARTGSLFAFQDWAIEPDCLVLGKGMGGGVIPQAGLLCSSQSSDRAAPYAVGHYTHEKSPIGAAVAEAVLDVILEENLCERAQVLGRCIQESLAQRQSPIEREIRVYGALVGFEVGGSGLSIGQEKELAQGILAHCMSYPETALSFKIGNGNVLVLSPPLTISDQELQRALFILHSALDAAESLCQKMKHC
jgi:4-aminobutyrate aminotransferase